MVSQVSDDLIRRQAAELQDIELTDERCAELAVEVDSYNRQVADAAGELAFDDEPADFSRLLRALRAPPSTGE